MAEMLITVAIIVILCAFGFVAVIAHQRNLKRMEMDETAQEIFIAAQNHLIAARASGQWSSFLKETKSDAGKASRGTKPGYTPSDYQATSDANAASRDFYAISNDEVKKEAGTGKGAMELILPEGSIDETLRGNHFYVEYDAASGTVYGVFYTDSDHEITAEDAQKVSRTEPNARRDYEVDGKRTIIGYYGGALGELKNPKDLYAPAVAVRNAESLVLYVVDKNYNRPVSSETGAANFQTELHLTIEGETSGQKAEKTVDSNGNVYNGDQISEGRPDENFSRAVLAGDSKKDFSVEVPDGVDGSRTKSVKAKYYALVLDSIVRENGHFADLFPGLIPGEDLKITVTLHSNAGGEDVSETVRVNSLFNSIKTEKKFFGLVDDTTVVTVSNPRHLENLSSEVSGVDFQNKQIKKNVTVDSVSIVRDLFWDTDSAAANADNTQQSDKEKVTPFLEAIETAKGMESLYGYCAGGRTSIDKNSVQVYPYTGASAGEGSGTAGSTGTDRTAERISVGACYGITNPAIRRLEGNNHILAAFRFEGKEQSALINEGADGVEIRNLLIADATSAATGERKAAQGTGSSDTVPVAAILIANAKSGSIENIAVRWYEASGTDTVNQEVKISGSRPELAAGLNGCRIYSANGIASALIGTVDAVKADGTKESFIIKNTTVKTVASSTEKDTAHLGVEGETAAALIGEVRGGTVTLDNSKESDEKKKSTVTVEGTLALAADRGQENNQVAGGLVGSVSGGKEVRLEEVNLTAKELTVSSTKSAGGLVGEYAPGTSDGSLTAEKVNLSANALDVTGKKSAGGAIGNASGGTVTLKEINVLTTKAAGDSGEAGQTATGTEKVYGIRVTAENGKAGGLVGAAESGLSNLTIESCAVSGSGTADQIEAGSSAGGLIGDTQATTTSITGSMASMYVQSEGNGGNPSGTSSTDGAGGLIGSASGSVTINDSYSGGRTKTDSTGEYAGKPRYATVSTGQGRFNVQLVSGSGAAGGLLGKYSGGNLVLSNTYSTSSVAVSYISNAKAGGLVGEADSLNASNTYCTGRVYFTSGTSNGAMTDEPNDTSNIGTYAGSLGNFSGNGNYYLEGLKGISKGSVGTLNGSKNPTEIDEKLLTGANYYDNDCPIKSGVSESQKTYTFDSSLAGQTYPYETVNTSFAKPLYDPATGEKVENAEQDGNQNESKYAQIGDWEIPEEESTEFGPYALIYYERIWNPDTNSLDPTFYYHGYALPDGAKGTDGNVTYTEISTPQDKLPEGITWNNHHLITSKDHYVAEDGYLLLISKDVLNETSEDGWTIELQPSGSLNNDLISSVKNKVDWNPGLVSLNKYKGDTSSSAEFKGYTAYSLDILGDSDKWRFRPNKQNFGTGLVLWKNSSLANGVPEAGFTYTPFFADAVRGADQGKLQNVSKAWAWNSSLKQYESEDAAEAIIRSARQLRRCAAFNNSEYGYLSNDSVAFAAEQRMDISFDQDRVKFYDQGREADSSWYNSPTINQIGTSNVNGKFSSALRPDSDDNSNDYYVLDGLNNTLIGAMQGGQVYNLQITNMNAECVIENIHDMLNIVSARNISVTNSKFTKGIIGTISQAHISDISVKHTEFTNNGLAETIGEKCTITNCTMRDVRVGGNGFSSSVGQDSKISNCSIVNAVIGENGFANETKASIQDCTIINAIIGKNGFAYQNSGTITSCGIYGDEDKYSDNPADEDYSEYYQPNTHTRDDNVTGSENKAYGYNLVTIGITTDGNRSSDSDIAGFVNQNTGSITGCYVAGKVYGQNNVAGFVFKHAAGTSIANSYANVLIYAGKNASGFANELADYNGSIRNCHALGMISCQGDASGAIGQITNGTVQGVYQAFWKVNAKNWYPFYKIQNARNVQNNYYLADCEINADDSELVDYGQKVKALSHQQLCDLSIDSLQKGTTEKNTTGYYQYMSNDNKAYPYPMSVDQVAYGDWSHQDPGKITLLYYEKKGINYYFHGYSTTDGEYYKEEKTSGNGLENGLLASANTTIDEDGYVLIIEKNAGWSSFGRADNTGAVSSEENFAKSSVFEKASDDLMTALKSAGFTANSDRMYSFSLDKYLNYQDTAKEFASWQTLTQESGGVGITIYTTKGKVPTAKFSFQPFFADTVTQPAVTDGSGTSSEKTLSFQTTRHSGSDYDYRIRTLRQLKALSDWDGQRFGSIADKDNLKKQFDKDSTKRFSYLSTTNEQYENYLTIRQDLDIDVDGAEINFDRLDGNYIGRKYDSSSDEPVSLKNIAYDFADVVAPSGSICSLIVSNANLTGTATTSANGNEVAHGGRREFVEYNYGTISYIVVKNSTLGSAGLVYQNGDVPENVVKESSRVTDQYPKYFWISENNNNACQYATKITYEINNKVVSGAISNCEILNSTIECAGLAWKNKGGSIEKVKIQQCSIGHSGLVEYNQATAIQSPKWVKTYQYWYQNGGKSDSNKVPNGILEKYNLPLREESGEFISVTVNAIINNCQVVDCTVKTNGFVGENSVNTQGSTGVSQGSSGVAKITNCQVYGTDSYTKLKVGIGDTATSGASDASGFAGTNGEGAIIENCSVTGTVTATTTAAGFIHSNAGTITGSYANTESSVTGNSGSSIAGFALTNTGTIEKSHSLGTLQNASGSNAENSAAGFVIHQKANVESAGKIKNSYAAVWQLDVLGTGVKYLPFGSDEGTYENCYAMKLSKDDGYDGSYSGTAPTGVNYVSGEDLNKREGKIADLGSAVADDKTTPYSQAIKSEKYPFPCGSDIMNYGDWKLTDAAATARTVTLDAGNQAAFSEELALSLSKDAVMMTASDESTDGTTKADGESSSTVSVPEEDRQKVQVELGEEEETLDLSQLVPERKGWKLLGWLITAPSELTASTEKITVSDIVTKVIKVSDGSAEAEDADAQNTENAGAGAGDSEETEAPKAVYQLETGTKSYHFAPDAVITVTEDMTLSAVWVPDDDTIAKAKAGTSDTEDVSTNKTEDGSDSSTDAADADSSAGKDTSSAGDSDSAGTEGSGSDTAGSGSSDSGEDASTEDTSSDSKKDGTSGSSDTSSDASTTPSDSDASGAAATSLDADASGVAATSLESTDAAVTVTE